jgi:hypothetical protein
MNKILWENRANKVRFKSSKKPYDTLFVWFIMIGLLLCMILKVVNWN